MIKIRKVIAGFLTSIVVFLFVFISVQPTEASVLRGKWKTEYSEMGSNILAYDICSFSIFIKECYASDSRDIRIYKKIK